MRKTSLKLRPVKVEDELSFKAAVEEFRQEQSPFEFAMGYGDCASFKDYVRRLKGWPRGENLPAGFVPGWLYVGIVNGEVVGRLSLRYHLNEFLSRIGGHIGYGVRPSQRRRGYASEMLRQVLPICARLGFERVLITCDANNIGSMKVIERCGGVFEVVTDYPELEIQKRRYWINTETTATTGSVIPV